MGSSRHTTDSPSRWITPPRIAGILALIAPMTWAPLPGGGAQTSPAQSAAVPMTNEDVVKMTARGDTPEEIIQMIEQAVAVDFDLDPEIVAELRTAGVAPSVMQAMMRAQKKSPPARPGAPRSLGAIELIFEKDARAAESKNTAVMFAQDWNDRKVSLAFYVYCLDSLHVPDMWQAATPLASNFPRHHLLWFHEEIAPHKHTRRGDLVALRLPDRASVPAEEGTHPLGVGVAARAGDLPWERLAETEATIEVMPGRPSRLTVRVKTRGTGWLGTTARGAPGITVQIVAMDPPAAVAPPDPNAPAPP